MNTVLVPERTAQVAACSRPTICQLVWNLGVGGAEVLASRFATGSMLDARWVFACLDFQGPLGEQLRHDGYEVEVLHRVEGRVDWGCVRRLARFCTRHHVDLIHAHQCGPFHYAALSRLGQRLPILLTEHGRPDPDIPSWKRIWAHRLLLRSYDRVIAVGNDVRDSLARVEGFPKQRIDVIYNGRDLIRYSGSDHRRSLVRQELGLSKDDVVIVQVARLSAEKDHRTAVAAVHRLAQRQRRVKLLLVGDGKERGEIEEQVRQLKLTEYVHFLGLRQDVEQLLPAADIFLLSSRSEGVPLTLIEAMGAGLPCVATAAGGTEEVVVHGETGLLSPVGDSSELASHLDQLVLDRDRRQELGLAARQRAELHFDELSMHRAYADLYQQMISLDSSQLKHQPSTS